MGLREERKVEEEATRAGSAGFIGKTGQRGRESALPEAKGDKSSSLYHLQNLFVGSVRTELPETCEMYLPVC